MTITTSHRRTKLTNTHHSASSSDSNSASDPEFENHQSLHQRMLNALTQHSMQIFAFDEPSSSSGPSKNTTHCTLSDPDHEEEWSGIPLEFDCNTPLDDFQIRHDDEINDESECNSSVDDDGFMDDDDLDDGEDLLQASRKLEQPLRSISVDEDAEVIVFQDPSRASGRDSTLASINAERKAFMAPLLKKQNMSASDIFNKKNASTKEQAEEAHLQSLDRSLSNLISTLSAPTSKTVALDTILSTDLPPPIKSLNPQRHPRMIKQGLARANLRRSQAADREAAMGSIVRAHGSKTITKQQKRSQDGTEDRERRERRARADKSIGSTRGGMITLSEKEINMVAKGGSTLSRPKTSQSNRRR